MRRNKNLKTRIFSLALTLSLLVLALPMTAFAVNKQSNMSVTFAGTATPAGNGEVAVSYEFTDNPLWASGNSGLPLFYGGTYDDITFEAVYTSISGVTDYGTMTFNQTGFTYTPSAEVGGKTVQFKLKATENGTTVTNDATWNITVAATPASGSSDATLSSLTYRVDGGETIAISSFDADTDSYTVWLPYGTEEGKTITLSGDATDTNASVGECVTATTDYYGDDATISVTAENGTTKTYTVTFEIEDPEVDPWVYFDGTYYGAEVDNSAVYITNGTNKIFAVCHGYGNAESIYSVNYFFNEDRTTGSSFWCDYYATAGYDAVYIYNTTYSVTLELYDVDQAYHSSNDPYDIWEIDVYWLDYIASEDTITVTCTNEVKPDNYPTDGYEITIVAPEASVYGSEDSFEATITNEAANIIDTDDIAITYKDSEGNTLDVIPTDIGTYTASITVEGQTASVEYAIVQKEVTVVIDDLEIVRGMDIPTLTGKIIGDTSTDAIIAEYSVTADNMVAGTYDIVMTNADAYPNYDIEITKGTLTITDGYTVNFDDVAVSDIAYGDTVTKPQEPTRDNYIFKGWYQGEEEFDFATSITGDVNLVSMWEAVEEKQTTTEDEVKTETTQTETTQTGDNNHPQLLVVLMVASLLGILLIDKRRVKQN